MTPAATELPIWSALLIAAIPSLIAYAAGRRTRRDEKSDKAAELLNRYRDPLLGAAFELQSRLYNIVRERFFDGEYAARGSNPVTSGGYARLSSLWVIGQFLGWVEILRREIQFLDLGGVDETRDLQRELAKLSGLLASDAPHVAGPLMIFRAHQRAIGDAMIRWPGSGDAASRAYCMGYSAFVEERHKRQFWMWFEPLEKDLEKVIASPREQPRLILVQRAAADLLDVLDPDHIRFPDPNTRGRLPLTDALEEHERDARGIARFGLHPSEREAVTPVLDAWAADSGIRLTRKEGESTGVRRAGFLGAQTRVTIADSRSRIVVHAVLIPPGWQRALFAAPREGVPLVAPGRRRNRLSTSLERRRWWWARRQARKTVNALLRRFDRPPI